MDMASVALDVRNCGTGLVFDDCLFAAGNGALSTVESFTLP